MIRPHRNKSSKSGFTLLEIIVAVAILVLLIGAVSLNAGSFVGRGKTGRVMKFMDGLKMACAAYHVDMGSYAYEYSGYPPVHQKLSSDQAGGWDGPYIDNPLTRGQNPFGGNVHLYNRVTANNWISGFDLNGDGTDDVTSDGNMLWMSAVPQESAESIDKAIDGQLAGTWSDAGRVRYNASNRYMFILVYN